MVQITRNDSSETDGPAPHRDQLLYSKSKVYVHPTAYARDNIPGFVALTKRVSRASAASPRVCRGADAMLHAGRFEPYLSPGMDPRNFN